MTRLLWSFGKVVLVKDRTKVNHKGHCMPKEFLFYETFEKNLSGDCVKEFGLNGLKRVSEGFSQIVNMNRKVVTLKKEKLGEQKFSFRHDIKQPGGSIESWIHKSGILRDISRLNYKF